MVFKPPRWVPSFKVDEIPDSIPISQFMLDEKYGRAKLCDSKAPFICGLSGAQYTTLQVKQRVQFLGRALEKSLNWSPNKGSEWGKVVTIFAHNTLDSMTLCWALHTLSGIPSPANSAYNVSELTHQVKSSGSKAIFTCLSLLDTALKAATICGIQRGHVYLLSMPFERQIGYLAPTNFKSVDQLISEGSRLPQLEPLRWEKGQGARQCAFLNYSSGTTGLPKGVMVSHKNLIANILQVTTFEASERQPEQYKVVLGVLPQSHIYSIVSISHISIYRGDAVVVLPKFELPVFANAIATYKINTLFVVPPIILQMINFKQMLNKFDLSSVTQVLTGAAPLGAETYVALSELYPSWHLSQGYGLTETTSAVSLTSTRYPFPGSSGSLLPGQEARLISLRDGSDITKCGEAGELLVRSPSVTSLGYLHDDKATQETFRALDGGWMRTGDEAMFVRNTNSADGEEHLFIIDRIKELIKVNGYQVAPAELEACLLSHPLVADAAVIPVPDVAAGEVPKAFIVLAPHHRGQLFQSPAELAEELETYIQHEKANFKWLRGGIEFVDVIPKSPSGKILRRILREAERLKRRQRKGKL